MKKYVGRVYIGPSCCNTPLKITVRAKNNPDWRTNSMPAFVRLQMNGPVKCTLDNSLNIYAGKFNTNELMPNVSNADFLRNIIKGLGLNFFTDGRKKKAEISAFRDITEAKSLDITEIAEKEETENTKTDTKRIKYTVAPVQEYNKENEEYRGETEILDGEPTFEHKNEVWLYKPANGYMKAEEEEDEDESWIVRWKLKGGNSEYLELGEGDDEDCKTDIKIPANTTFIEYGTLQYTNIPEQFGGRLPNIPVKMRSPLMENLEENPSDIILMYYRGFTNKSKINPDLTITTDLFHEDMCPTQTGEFSLKAKGDNSLGEKYMRPYLKVKKLNDEIKYKARVDIRTALTLMNLLMPQDENPSEQTRFIHANGVKSVPKKISFQIENKCKNGTMMCEIDAVKVN